MYVILPIYLVIFRLVAYIIITILHVYASTVRPFSQIGRYKKQNRTIKSRSKKNVFKFNLKKHEHIQHGRKKQYFDVKTN